MNKYKLTVTYPLNESPIVRVFSAADNKLGFLCYSALQAAVGEVKQDLYATHYPAWESTSSELVDDIDERTHWTLETVSES